MADPPLHPSSTHPESHHPDPHARVSFASIVAKHAVRPRFPELQINSRQYGWKDGVPSVSFSVQEIQAATDRFKFTIIAKFQSGRPSITEIRNFFASHWAIKGRATVTSNWDDRHVVIILDSEEDVNVALTCPYRKIGNTLFRLFRWTANYNPKKEATKITKWIRLPNFPMRLFDRNIIRAVVSSFSDFLDIDDRTKELTTLHYARACVEIDVLQEIPNCVWVNMPGNEGFYQDVIVEGGMLYCMKCRMHGHDLQNCRKKKQQQASHQVQSDNPTHAGTENGNNGTIAGAINREAGWQAPKKIARRVYRPKNKAHMTSVHEGVENNDNMHEHTDDGMMNPAQNISSQEAHVTEDNNKNDDARDAESEEVLCEQTEQHKNDNGEGIKEIMGNEIVVYSGSSVEDKNEKETSENSANKVNSMSSHSKENVEENIIAQESQLANTGTIRVTNDAVQRKPLSPPRTRGRAKAINGQEQNTRKYLQLTDEQRTDAIRFASNPNHGAQDIPQFLRRHV